MGVLQRVVLKKGLVVPRSFLTKTTSQSIKAKFEDIIHLKELRTHMDILAAKLKDLCFCKQLGRCK